jgi:hypothetical protein
VIRTLNEQFVPVIHDVSDPGAKGRVPALGLWEQAYESNWAYREGFATTVIISADATVPLGTTGIARHHWRDVGPSGNHLPDVLLDLLADSKERQERLDSIRGDLAKNEPGDAARLDALQDEIIRAIQKVNPGNDGRSAQ